MSVPFSPWQQRAYDQTVAALDAGRLGHGLLICGPAGLGKREVALALAAHVLGRGDEAAARRSEQLIAAGTHPDLQLVSFIPNKSGDKLRTEIVIEQVREISQKLALTPQYGVAQVVVVDPADAINRAACNALLKTLEEPAPGRYLWLISSDPARLPATIRSRCQRLEFKLPPRAEAMAWLLRDGPRRLWVGVWSENHGAQRFYQRYGFAKAGEYLFPVGSQRDLEFVLRRDP